MENRLPVKYEGTFINKWGPSVRIIYQKDDSFVLKHIGEIMLRKFTDGKPSIVHSLYKKGGIRGYNVITEFYNFPCRIILSPRPSSFLKKHFYKGSFITWPLRDIMEVKNKNYVIFYKTKGIGGPWEILCGFRKVPRGWISQLDNLL